MSDNNQTKQKGSLSIAAIGDLHIRETDTGRLSSMLTQINQVADVLLLCGDLTDQGAIVEATVLADELRACSVPVIAVLGNHDYESGVADQLGTVLTQANVHLLDGNDMEIHGVGFVGVKGFPGGFLQYMLPNWGEPEVKTFVYEGVQEALKLESALSRMETKHKVALLHYAPIRDTIVGEPLEIFPFLGSSRLEGPLNRFGVDVAFHGHAHHGTLAGHTEGKVPVFNVALPLVRAQKNSDFFLYTLKLD
ncbi:metallophosphoesterase [Candidatus Woesebacteria bacterium]|nr:metallophosphoesterase [Candidatus Woesebacteria bacterium]